MAVVGSRMRIVSGRCACGREHTGQFVQEPVLGRAEALLVLLGSTGHFDCYVRLVVDEGSCRREVRCTQKALQF